MTYIFMFAIYFIVWWVVLFTVLPFGVQTQAEAGEVVPGTPESAPASFRLWRVLVATTVVATIVFSALWFATTMRIIDIEGLMAGAT
jgi:predicted secreted protein